MNLRIAKILSIAGLIIALVIATCLLLGHSQFVSATAFVEQESQDQVGREQIPLIVFTAVIAGATVYYAITTRRLWQATKKSFQYTLLSSYKETLGAEFSRKAIEAVFAGELKEITREFRTKGITEESVLQDLRAVITAEELNELVNKGQIELAVKKAEKLYHDDPSKYPQLVSILLSSKDEKNWNKAWSILGKIEEGNFKPYLSLAYSFWSINRAEDAIKVGEKGLRIAEKQGDKLGINKLKNSLAYYYADTGDSRFEDSARTYAEEAYAARLGEAEPMDTKGYVKIIYGKTAEEIEEGIYLCEEARRQGISFEFYIKHITKAAERRRSF